jgi:hypothetical protein
MDHHFDTFDFVWRCLDAAVPLSLGVAALIYFPRRFAREIEIGKRPGEEGRKLGKWAQILGRWMMAYGTLKLPDIFYPGISICFLVGAAVVWFFWWLSGYDPKLERETKTGGFIRRALYCGVTYALVGLSFKGLWQYVHGNDDGGAFYLATALPLAIIWAGSLSNLWAHGFISLIDTADNRPFDPQEEIRQLDEVAELIRQGRKAEAIKMCEKLKTWGEADILTVGLVLEHLGVPQAGLKTVKPLTQAKQLRLQGQFRQAELILTSLLLKNSQDLDAAMMLMRLYAQDLNQPEKAVAVLHRLEQQPHVSPAHIEFARRSISDWNQPPAPLQNPPPVPPPESLDDLLKLGFFGTAIERLETQIQEQPQDYDLRLKLMEVHGARCGNFPRAEKILQQIEANQRFTSEQIQQAKIKLREWREMPPTKP